MKKLLFLLVAISFAIADIVDIAGQTEFYMTDGISGADSSAITGSPFGFYITGGIIGGDSTVPVKDTIHVAESGGDFTTLSAATASLLGRNIVTGDSIIYIEISGAWSKSDTLAVVIPATCTTSAIRNINIYTVGASRHSGLIDSTAYRLRRSVGDAITIENKWVKIDGLAIIAELGAGSNRGIYENTASPSAASNISISNCVVRSYSGSGLYLGGYANTINIWNNIIYDINAGRGARGIYINSGSGPYYVYSNTVCKYDNGIYQGGGTYVAINNIAINNGDNFNGTFTSSDYNYSTTGDAPGVHSVTDGTLTFTDSANGDFHLALDASIVIGAGISLAADPNLPFSTDIDGNDRGISWDIGADQYIAETTCDSILQNIPDSLKSWCDAIAVRDTLFCDSGSVTMQYAAIASASWTSGDAVTGLAGPVAILDTTGALTPSTDYKFRFVFAADTGSAKDTSLIDTFATLDSTDISEYWLYEAPTLMCSLTVARTPTAGGTTNPAPGEQIDTCGDTLTIVALPATSPAGYTFGGWDTASSGVEVGDTTADTTWAIFAAGAGAITAHFTCTSPTVAYAPTAVTCTVGLAMETLVPTLGGGARDSLTISPALSAGLSMPKTGGFIGQISGTPSVVRAATTYTITAHNCGTGTDQIAITVIDTATIKNINKPNPRRWWGWGWKY